MSVGFRPLLLLLFCFLEGWGEVFFNASIMQMESEEEW